MAKFSQYQTVASASDSDLLLIDQIPIVENSVKTITKADFLSDVVTDSISRMATITIGTTGMEADYICDGTADGSTIKSAIAALPSTGGRILVRNGTYNFDTSADRIFLVTSNVFFEGETFGGVIFKATASLHPGGGDSLGRRGIFTVGATNTTLISNITVKNIVFDINHVNKTAGFTLDGGTSLTDQIGLQNVLVENVIVKNHGLNTSEVVEAGLFVLSGRSNTLGSSKGRIDNVIFRNVTTQDSNKDGWWVSGEYAAKLKFENCNIYGSYRHGLVAYSDTTQPTHTDWTFLNCRFDGNMIGTSVNAQAHYRDATQTGVINLVFDSCYFGPTLNPSTSQDFTMTPYWATKTRVSNCILDQGGAGISLGASISGGFGRLFSANQVIIENNFFYKMRQCFDDDSNVFTTIKGNTFYECKQDIPITAYSEHFPTTIEDNTFYDCHVDEEANSSATDVRRSVLRLNANGMVVRNNKFIDDRQLQNASGSLTLGSSAAGALSLRTYYVRFTYSNATGETLASTSQSTSVAANRVLTVTYSPTATPTGARFINYYVGTVSGSETLQTSIALPTKSYSWTEPTTGLVSGATLPTSNTTHTITKKGIYETSGGGGQLLANIYENNYFVGIESEIVPYVNYNHISKGNITNRQNLVGQDKLLEGTTFVNVKDYQARGDVLTLTDGAITSGTNVLSSSSASFNYMDIGKTISVIGAGAAGVALVTTISGWNTNQQVTLTANASTTVSGAKIQYGTNDTAAFQSAADALNSSGGSIYVPTGNYFVGVTGSVKTSSRTAVIGDGTSTVLTLKPGTNDFMFATRDTIASPTSYPHDHQFRGLAFDLNSACNTTLAAAISSTKNRNATIENCLFNNWNNNCVYFSGSDGNNVQPRIINNQFDLGDRTNGCGIKLDSGCYDSYLESNDVGRAWRGIIISNGGDGNHTLVSNWCWGNEDAGMYIYQSNGVQLNSCTWDQNFGPGLVIDGCDGVTIQGGKASNNSFDDAGNIFGFGAGHGTANVSSGILVQNTATNISINGVDFRNPYSSQKYAVEVKDSSVTDVSGGSVSSMSTAAFSITSPALLSVNNVRGVNPKIRYAQGNVTGATTFNRLNGETITATLTGDITVTLTSGLVAGDRLRLVLTQDGTGSRLVTWPSNFKKAGGTLTLSTGASAVDVIEMVHDGTNWREVSRALNLS